MAEDKYLKNRQLAYDLLKKEGYTDIGDSAEKLFENRSNGELAFRLLKEAGYEDLGDDYVALFYGDGDNSSATATKGAEEVQKEAEQASREALAAEEAKTQRAERTRQATEGRAMFDEMSRRKGRISVGDRAASAPASSAKTEPVAPHITRPAETAKPAPSAEALAYEANEKVYESSRNSSYSAADALGADTAFRELAAEGQELQRLSEEYGKKGATKQQADEFGARAAEYDRRMKELMDSPAGREYKDLVDRYNTLKDVSDTPEIVKEKNRIATLLSRNPIARAMMGDEAPGESQIRFTENRAEAQDIEAQMETADRAKRKELKKRLKEVNKELLDNEYYQEDVAKRRQETQAQLDDVLAKMSDIEKRYLAQGKPESAAIDPEYRELNVAAQDYAKSLRQLGHIQDKNANNFWVNFADVFTDLNTYTFGMAGLDRIFATKTAMENPDEAGSQEVLSAVSGQNALQQEISQFIDSKGRWGSIAGNSIPFAAQIILTGGGGNVANYVSQGVKSKLGRNLFTRILGAGLGDIAAGFTMANTIGAGKTLTDILDRYYGTLVADGEGGYGYEGGTNLAEAIWKGEAGNTIEFASERAGEHIQRLIGKGILGKAISAARKNGGKINPAVEELAKSMNVYLKDFNYRSSNQASANWMQKAMGGFFKVSNMAGVQGYPFEVMEEYIGLVGNILVGGEEEWMNFSKLGDKETHADIWGGMLYSIGVSQGGAIALGTGGLAYSGIEKARLYHKLESALAADAVSANELLGSEEWTRIKEEIDGTSNEELAKKVAEYMDNPAYDAKQREAVLDYVKNTYIFRGFNAGTLVQAKERLTGEPGLMSLDINAEAASAQDQVSDAYMLGYNLSTNGASEDELDEMDRRRRRTAVDANAQRDDIEEAVEKQRAYLEKLTGVANMSEQDASVLLNDQSVDQKTRDAALDYLMGLAVERGFLDGEQNRRLQKMAQFQAMQEKKYGGAFYHDTGFGDRVVETAYRNNPSTGQPEEIFITGDPNSAGEVPFVSQDGKSRGFVRRDDVFDLDADGYAVPGMTNVVPLNDYLEEMYRSYESEREMEVEQEDEAIAAEREATESAENNKNSRGIVEGMEAEDGSFNLNGKRGRLIRKDDEGAVFEPEDGSDNTWYSWEDLQRLSAPEDEVTPTESEPAVPGEPVEEPAEEEEKPKIPLDKDNNPIYDAPGVSVEDALADMYTTDGLDEADVDEYIINKANEAEKGRAVKQGKMSLKEWGQAKKEANRKADFWKEMKAFAEENKAAREKAAKEEAARQELIKQYGLDTSKFDLTPQTAEEAVSEYLGRSEKLINLDDAIRETLGKRKDNRVPSEIFRHIGAHGILTKQGGRSVADVARDIVGEYEGTMSISEDDVRDAIIDALTNKTKSAIRETIFNNRLQQAQDEADILEEPMEEEYGPVIRTFNTRGGLVEVRTKTTEKDGVKTTKVVALRDGREIATRGPKTTMPVPEGYTAADVTEGVVGLTELRESADGTKAATALVKLEDGTYSEMETKLVETPTETEPVEEEAEPAVPDNSEAPESAEEAPEAEETEPAGPAEPAETAETAPVEDAPLGENETQEIRDAVDAIVSGKDTKKYELDSGSLPDDYTIAGKDVNSYIRERYDRFVTPLQLQREKVRKEMVAYRDGVEEQAKKNFLARNPHITEDNPYLPDYVSEEAGKMLKNDSTFNDLNSQIDALDEQIGNYQSRRHNAVAKISEIVAKQTPAEPAAPAENPATPKQPEIKLRPGDILLRDMADEIDPWAVERLEGVGFNTGMEVLEADLGTVALDTDIDMDAMAEIYDIIRRRLKGVEKPQRPTRETAPKAEKKEEKKGEENAENSSESPEKSVTSQKEEKAPEEPAAPQELTEEQIRKSGYPDADVIESAVDYVNGERGFAETLAYNQIKEYVGTQRTTTEQAGETSGQSQLDEGPVQTSGLGAEQGGGAAEQVGNGENGEGTPGGVGSSDGSVLSGEGGTQTDGGAGRKAGAETRGSGKPGRRGGTDKSGLQLAPDNGGPEGGQGSAGAVGQSGVNAGSTDIDALGGELEGLLEQFNSTIPSLSPQNGVGEVLHAAAPEGLEQRERESGKLSRKQEKKPTVTLTLDGMTPQQQALATKIIFTASKLGYAYAKSEGLTTFNDFKRWFKGKFGDAVMKGLNYNESSLDAFMNAAWNTKMSIDGKRLQLREHAADLHNKELLATRDVSIPERIAMQEAANKKGVQVIRGSRKNIAESVPILTPGQWDDLVAIERQFFDDSHNDYDHCYGKGMLVSNGTGTGKTFTGLGTIKRFVDEGKGRVLVVAPASMTHEWSEKAKLLGIKMKELESKKDKGEGVVVTSYENFRDNAALYEDTFDLVVYDESQNIIENQQGFETLAFAAHRMIGNKNVEEAEERLVSGTETGRRRTELRNRYRSLETEKKKPKKKPGQTKEERINEIYLEQNSIQAQINDLTRQLDNMKPQFRAKAEEAVKRTKVLFLSATPFNTIANLRYGAGFIFNYPKVYNSAQQEITDASQKEQAFWTEWFRGDSPREELEVEFGDHLLDELETAYYRILENGYDYSREHPDVSGMVMATRFNAAMNALHNDPKYRPLYDSAKFIDNPLWTSLLYETMKVSAMRDRIKEHIAAGRKIVIFHDRLHRNNGGSTGLPPVGPPFQTVIDAALSGNNPGGVPVGAINEFKREFADVMKWEAGLDYRPVHEQIIDFFATDADRAKYEAERKKNEAEILAWQKEVTEYLRLHSNLTDEELEDDKEFQKILKKRPKGTELEAESVAVYNGECSKKEKEVAKAEFNDDNSKKNIICVTTRSGGAGLSLHDTTGKHQRVMIQTALPVSPIGFIQAEGRIFRWGNKSNAIFEYPRLGIHHEVQVFAQSFNAKAETVENIAHGFRGRGLKDSIMTGFYENSGNVPIDGEGVGGVERDRRGSALKGMAKAKHDYGVAKRKGIKDGDMSVPEPIGFSMATWGKAGNGDVALIPFAGRGSIARYIPKGVTLGVMEQDPALMTDLQCTAGRPEMKVREGLFGELGIMNKADVVILNGSSDQMSGNAVETMSKGFNHLSEGGRLIAVVPDNAETDAELKYLKDSSGGVLRTTIKVAPGALDTNKDAMRIVIIDKVSRAELRNNAPAASEIDLTNVSQEDLFKRLEDIKVPDRIIDNDAIKEKKVKAVLTEIRKNKLIGRAEFRANEDSRVRGPEVYIYMTDRFAKGMNNSKFLFESCGPGSYYDIQKWQYIRLSMADNLSKSSAIIKRYKWIKETLALSNDEFKTETDTRSAKQEDVETLKDLYRSYLKLVRAMTNLNESQLMRIAQGLRPDISASDIETLNGYSDLREKFEAANHEDSERQEMYDRVAEVAEKLGLTISAGTMDKGFAGGYNNRSNTLTINRSTWGAMSDDERATTLLHEFIHSVTNYAIRSADNDVPNMGDELTKYANMAKDIFKQITKGSVEDVAPLRGYSLENTDEMLAEMANPKVRERYKNRRMWVNRTDGKIKVYGFNVEGAEETTAWELLNEALEGMLKNFDKTLFKRFIGRSTDFVWNLTTPYVRIADGLVKPHELPEGEESGELEHHVLGQGSEEEEVYYRTSDEISAEYPNWMDDQTSTEVEGSQRGQNTQVAGTVGTYRKVGGWIESNLGKGTRILDASSGLGLGTLALQEQGFDVEDIEPYPGKGRKQQPTYGGEDAYQRAVDEGRSYDYIISNAVLNVIPDDWRSDVLQNMAKLLAPGGRMFINTRKAGEEKTIKNKIELDSEREVLVGTPERINSYQRFFTPSELKEYVQDELGDGYTVEVSNVRNSGTSGLAAVVVTKKGETRLNRRAENLRNPINRAAAITKINDISKKLGITFKEDRSLKAKGEFNAKTNEIRINIDAHKNTADIEATLLHEAVAHYGLRKLFGDEWKSLRQQLYKQAAPEIKARVDAIAKKYGLSNEVALEEYLAQIAEDGWFDRKEETFWQKVINAIKRMFSKIGIDAGYLTEADLSSMLFASYRNLQTGGALETAARVATAAALRRAAEASHEEEDNGPEDDGPSGTPTNDRTTSAEFKEFFGDWQNDPENASKVVDENGRPKLVAHGSRTAAEFSVFDYDADTEKARGSGKTPAFFFTDMDKANVYARNGLSRGRVIPAYLSIKKPAEIDYEGARFDGVGIIAKVWDRKKREWVPITNNKDGKNLKYFATEQEAVNEYARLNPGESYVRVGRDLILTREYDAKPHISEFIDGIDRNVNDGAIVKNIHEVNDTIDDYVVFSSNQIKSPDAKSFDTKDPDIYQRENGDGRKKQQRRPGAIETKEGTTFSGIEDRGEEESVRDFYYRVVRDVMRKRKLYDVILEDISTLPEEEQASYEEGLYDKDTGEITIFAKSAITSADDVELIVFHEALHKALDKLNSLSPWFTAKFNKAVVPSGFLTQENYDIIRNALSEAYREYNASIWDEDIDEEMYTFIVSTLMQTGEIGQFISKSENDKDVSSGLREILKYLSYDERTEADVRVSRIAGRSEQNNSGVFDLASTDVQMRDSEEESGVEGEESGERAEEINRFAVDEDNEILYRRAEEQAIARTADDMYDRATSTVGSAIYASQVDEYAPADDLQETIYAEKNGKKAKLPEKWRLSNRLRELGGQAMSETRRYVKEFMRPMWNAIADFRKAVRGENGKKMTMKELVRYVGLKSGLERNIVFAKRDAKRDYQKEYDARIDELKSRLKQKKAELDRLLKDGEISDVTYASRLAALQTDINEKMAEAEEKRKAHFAEVDLGDNGNDAKYKEYRKKDYSALMSWFNVENDLKRRDFPSRKAYQRAVLELQKQYVEGITDLESAEAEARRRVNDIEGQAGDKIVNEFWKRVNAATKETLDFQVEHNRISSQQRADILGPMQYYVPMRGFEDNTAEDFYSYYMKPNVSGFAPTILAAKGRTTRYDNPFGMIGYMHSSAVSQGLKNEAVLTLLDFVRKHPKNTLATITRAWFVQTGEVDADGKPVYEVAYPNIPEGATAEERDRAVQAFEEEMAEKKAKGEAYNAHREVQMNGGVVAFEREAHKNEHVVKVYEGGKEYGIIINGNPAAAQAINGVKRQGGYENVLEILRVTRRFLSSMFTTTSIPFWVSNFQRDHGQGLANTISRNKPAYVGKYILNRWKLLPQMFPLVLGEAEKGGKMDKLSPKLANYYRMYVENGGPMGQNRIENDNQFVKQMNRYIALQSYDKAYIARGAAAVFNVLARLGEAVETITRFSAFVTSMEMGRSLHEAISDSKEVSTNFARKGHGRSISWEETGRLETKRGRQLGDNSGGWFTQARNTVDRGLIVGLTAALEFMRAGIPFFNAAIQGIKNKVDTYKKAPVKAAIIDGVYFAIGFAMRFFAGGAGGDDDKEKYGHMSDYTRRNNFAMPLDPLRKDGKFGGVYHKWALPQEYRYMYALGDILAESMLQVKPADDLAIDAYQAMAQLLPAGAVDPSESGKDFLVESVKSVSPGGVTPVIEAFENKDFKGSRIYNEGFNGNKENDPGWTKALETTGQGYVAAAEWLNKVTGGGEENAAYRGWIDLNPAIVEHFVKSYFSGPYQILGGFGELIGKKARGEEITDRDIPVWNRLIMNANDNKRDAYYSAMYYYFKDRVKEAQRLEAAMKGHTSEQYNEFRHSQDYAYMLTFGAYDSNERNYNKMRKEALNVGDKELAKEIDRERDTMREEIAKQCLDIYFDRVDWQKWLEEPNSE